MKADEKIFNQLDINYENPQHLMHKKMCMVLPLFKCGNSFLDVGCGSGELLFNLKDRYTSLVGIDSNRNAIKVARKKLSKFENVIILETNFDKYSPTHKYDACAMLDVLEHNEHPEKMLIKAKQLLRKGGQLIITVPNWYDKINIILGYNQYHHKVSHSSFGWASMIKRAGFKIEKIRSVDFPMIHFDFLCSYLHLFGMCIIISCTKI